jgi:hypothetical protein
MATYMEVGMRVTTGDQASGYEAGTVNTRMD